MVIAFKRNTLIALVRQLNMVEISLVVSLGESTMLKQANLSKADFVLNKKNIKNSFQRCKTLARILFYIILNKKKTNKMRNYLITYSWPEKYRGSYLISAEDGIDASNKLSSFLKEKYGATNNSNSIVTEVIGDSIQIVG